MSQQNSSRFVGLASLGTQSRSRCRWSNFCPRKVWTKPFWRIANSVKLGAQFDIFRIKANKKAMGSKISLFGLVTRVWCPQEPDSEPDSRGAFKSFQLLKSRLLVGEFLFNAS